MIEEYAVDKKQLRRAVRMAKREMIQVLLSTLQDLEEGDARLDELEVEGTVAVLTGDRMVEVVVGLRSSKIEQEVSAALEGAPGA